VVPVAVSEKEVIYNNNNSNDTAPKVYIDT
jgi:hypothetical protein